MLEIQNIVRAGSVKRWHTVNTTRQQTLAEHMYLVAMIARDIAHRIGFSDAAVIKYALEHDLDEINDGDIPSPSKRRMELEGVVFSYLGSNEPEKGTIERTIVKAADLIECWWFIKENGAGRHAAKCCMYVDSTLTQYIEEVRVGYADLGAAIDKARNAISAGEILF